MLLASSRAAPSAAAAIARRQPAAPPALRSSSSGRRAPRRAPAITARAFKVTVEHAGKTTELEVEDGATILDAASDAGLDLPCDCRMGVCFECAAKVDSGDVDQGAGTLSEDVIAKGYALLCVSTVRSDARVRTIEQEELLEEQLVAGKL